jgi:hypothetical protein
MYTVGRTPWTGDQHVASPLPKHRKTVTQNKRTTYRYTCFEWNSNPRSQSSEFERAKTVHASDRAATLIDRRINYAYNTKPTDYAVLYLVS